MKRGLNSSIQGALSARDNLHTGRYGLDSSPIRHAGTLPPIREAENDHAFVEAKDWYFGVFNMHDPNHKQHGLTLSDVMNACANQLFQMVERERIVHKNEDGTLKLSMYVEWIELYRELDGRFKQNLSSMSPTNGPNQSIIS